MKISSYRFDVFNGLKTRQLKTIVDKEIIFPKSYPYTSSTTKVLRENFKELYQECKNILNLKNDLIVDIGSNDKIC